MARLCVNSLICVGLYLQGMVGDILCETEHNQVPLTKNLPNRKAPLFLALPEPPLDHCALDAARAGTPILPMAGKNVSRITQLPQVMEKDARSYTSIAIVN